MRVSPGPVLAVLILSGIGLPAVLRAGEEAMNLYVEIPSVVAVDVKGDLTFDLTRLPVPRSPSDCDNVFPPGSACRVATYDPTTGPGSITVAVFDNTERGTAALTEVVAPTWSGGVAGPLATTNLQSRDLSNAGNASGPAFQALKTAPSEIAKVAAGASWITFTRSFRLVLPVSSLQETPKQGIQTTVTYSVSHSD